MTRAEVRALRFRTQAKQRTVAGRAFDASYTYGEDGDAVPTGDVSVDVYSVTGTLLVTVGAVQVDDTATYVASLTGPDLASVDLLTLAWLAPVGDDVRADVTVLDVCGSRLFTVAEMRRLPDMASVDKYPPEGIERERIAAEDFLEAQCGRAFAVRVGEALVNHAEWYVFSGLQLPTPEGHEIRALSIDGEEIDAEGLLDYSVGADSFAFGPNAALTDVNLDITYTHGAFAPDAGRVASILARRRLIYGPLDDRATSLAVEGGGTIGLITPGVRGSRTGIPEVDAFIERYV